MCSKMKTKAKTTIVRVTLGIVLTLLLLGVCIGLSAQQSQTGSTAGATAGMVAQLWQDMANLISQVQADHTLLGTVTTAVNALPPAAQINADHALLGADDMALKAAQASIAALQSNPSAQYPKQVAYVALRNQTAS